MDRTGLLRVTPRSLTYVATVALVAAAGFVVGSPLPIGLAAVLALPASAAALPCYYVAYGLLALVPGANPSGSTRTEYTDGTTVTSVVTGMPATWFTVGTHLLGVLALAVAAVLNVLLVRRVVARRRSRPPGRGAAPPG